MPPRIKRADSGIWEPTLGLDQEAPDEHPFEALATWARELAGEGIEVRCCAGCEFFFVSGLSYSIGRTGYCDFLGGKGSRDLRVVTADFCCPEHTLAPGWESAGAPGPGDRPAAGASRFEGAIVGLAAGDALGFASEFRTREQILASFGPEGMTDFVSIQDPRWPPKPAILSKPFPPGTVSDDTQMSVAVAEALIQAGQEDLDTLMNAMGRRFVEWSRSPDNDRAPGETCMTGCTRLAEGVPWREAGVAGSKGCGAAMRVAPIGLYYWHDRERLLEVARASSLLTHGHPTAVESAAAAALLVALALDRSDPAVMLDELRAECGARSPELEACLAKIPALIDRDPAFVLSKEGLGEGWVAEEAVASALYCFLRSPDDFAACVATAANTDGDSDSIACIAGSIAGAYNGAAAIPPRLAEKVEGAEPLREIARRLWHASLDQQAPANLTRDGSCRKMVITHREE